MKIREFSIKDYEEIVALWETCKLSYKPMGRDSKGNIKKELRKGLAVFLVAEHNNKIIASILGTHDGRKGWINRLAVLPEYRKKDIAKQLVKEVENKLHEQGIGIIACLIEDYNQSSLKVFQKLGYIEFPGMHYLTKRKFPEI